MDGNGRVNAHEVWLAMRAVYRQDREADTQRALLHALQDDLKPVNAEGRWRPHPLLVTAGVLMLAGLAVVFYFHLGRRV